MSHTTVLLHEAVDGLQLQPDHIVVDATFGSGGHAREILSRLKSKGTYIGIDADASALEGATLPPSEATVHLVNDNFRNITKILRSLHIEKVHAILADLGWRSEQFENSGKGFSFNIDEPLLMTFGKPEDYPFTAKDIVNDWEEETLANIFYGYADERFARRIARAIVETRKKEPIVTTKALASIVAEAIPKRFHPRRIHPATKSFQALRIAVNDELNALETFISESAVCLEATGRMSIITFHSLEDRIVKHSFRSLAETGAYRLITKKPITATREEITMNSRARSAKLRIIEKN
jgi:16S rRNA (cytosine1402-N4)-methyltransferase